MELWNLLADIVVLLTACLVGGGLLSRLGQSPLVGYLLGGMVIGGPGSLGLIQSQSEIEAIAELGVSLLLFSLGLEFSVDRLKGLGSQPLLGGIIQIVATLACVALAAWCWGQPAQTSLGLGAMMALSSTAVVLRILMERGEIEMPHGRNSLGVLLTQDMAVVPLAVLMTVLGGSGTAMGVLADVGWLTLMAIGLALALWVLTRVAVQTLGTLTLRRNRELTVLFASAIGLGSAWSAHAVGISPALGAFIAGMLLGSSAFATQIRADVATLRVLLLTLFFGAAGMVADPLWIVSHFPWVAGATIAVTIGKFLIVAIIFLMLRQSLRVATATGIALAQVGEFAFVLGSIGRNSGVISAELYGLVVSITIMSFIASAILVPLAPQLGDLIARKVRPIQNASVQSDRQAQTISSHHADVLLIGFGPTGQLASVPLMESSLRVTVLDLNREGIIRAKQYGFDGYVGDARSTDVLDHASIGEVQMVIITLPHFKSSLTIIEL
ncbi:MAG: cation:proton antiporter, partial [Planctomycetota bacterium]